MEVSRRKLLIAGGAGALGGLVGCAGGDRASRPDGPPSSEPDDPPDARSAARFFTPREAATVDAIAARIIPGDAADPGAHEAGVVHYIDGLMAVGGFAEPVYLQPPFVAPTDDRDEIVLPDGLRWEDVAPLVTTGGPGDEVPAGAVGVLGEEALTTLREDSVESTSFGVLPIPEGQFDRYGYQSFAAPPELYRRGLRSLDALCRERHDRPFVELAAAQQDDVLGSLEDGTAEGFDLPSAQGFFELVRRHTIEGMFADPIYGGNREFAGWRLIGYPGAYRAWTADELRTEGFRRPPQGIEQLARTHPGDHSGDGPPHVVAGAELPGDVVADPPPHAPAHEETGP